MAALPDPYKSQPFAPQQLASELPLPRLLPFFTRGIEPQSVAYDIMKAAASGDAAGLKSLLAKPGALPDFCNEDGVTPLMVAAARGHSSALEVLSSHPLVNLARGDNRGWTALHFSSWLGQKETTKQLLAHHAPALITDNQDKTPFDYAKGHAVEEIFWQDRAFARTQKRPAPLEEKSVPASAQAATPEAAPAAPQPAAPNPVEEAFYRMMLNIAVAVKANPKMGFTATFCDECAKMKLADFRTIYNHLSNSTDFRWDQVFISAAARNNTETMRFLQGKHNYQQEMLDVALSAAIAGGDNRDAVHHLVLWRANPAADYAVRAGTPGKGSGKTTNLDAAYALGRTGAFEEMIAFSHHALPKQSLAQYKQISNALYVTSRLERVTRGKNLSAERDAQLKQTSLRHGRFSSALEIANKKDMWKGSRTKPLREIFNAAVSENKLVDVIAAYAEAREDRFFRGRVEMEPAAGGGAIAIALLNERFELARLLISDGYHLKDASTWLQRKLEEEGSEKAKKFAADEKAGRLNADPIEGVGRVRASEFIGYYPGMGMYGGFGGRYGM